MKKYVNEDAIAGPRFRVNIGMENHPRTVVYEITNQQSMSIIKELPYTRILDYT